MLFSRIAIFTVAAFISSQSLADSARLLSSPEVSSLAQSNEWKKLLFFAKKTFNKQASLFDSPGFFIAADGKSDPLAELRAMLAGMYADPKDFPNQEFHPLCRFPVRAEFIIKSLKIDRQSLPSPKCELRETWLRRNIVTKVSLVFSSYYTDNPASMFGHSFLKLHVNPVGPGGYRNSQANQLLDFAVNYAAHTGDDVDVFTYYWKGFSGQFPGKFSMEPFYVKVQEYNNYEQRDLWIYELSLTQEDSLRLANIMWEIGENEINYFYFDDNCSALMLAMLDAAKPELDLYSKLPHLWIIPVDTLRVVSEHPSLVTSVDYIPSTRTKFLTRYRTLDHQQRELVDDLLAANDPGELVTISGLAAEKRIGVLDTLVELIDFKEDIAGAYLGDIYKQLRVAALSMRANTPGNSPKLVFNPPEHERPDTAHGTTLMSLAAGTSSKNGAIGQLHWRPALHGFADAESGFPDGLNIGFMNTKIAWQETSPKKNRLILRNFGGIEIKSIPTVEPVIRKKAWTMNVGQRHRFDCGPGADALCLSSYLNVGAGFSSHLLTSSMTGYLMTSGQLSILHDGYRSFAGEPGLLAGFILHPDGPLQMHLEAAHFRSFAVHETTNVTKVDLTAMYTLRGGNALILYGDFETRYGSAIALGYGIYF